MKEAEALAAVVVAAEALAAAGEAAEAASNTKQIKNIIGAQQNSDLTTTAVSHILF